MSSKHSTNLFSELIATLVYPSVAFTGFLFNFICAIVLMQKDMRKAKCDFFRYLFYKAVVNALFLALFAVETIVQRVFMSNNEEDDDGMSSSVPVEYFPTILAVSNIYYFVTEVLKALSILCEIAACLDRLLYVKQCCHACYRKIPPYVAFLVMLLISVLTHSHMLILFTVKQDNSNNNKQPSNSAIVASSLTDNITTPHHHHHHLVNNNKTTPPSAVVQQEQQQQQQQQKDVDHLFVNMYVNQESLSTDIAIWFVFIVIINIILVIINLVLWYETSKQMTVKKRLTAIESLIVYHRANTTTTMTTANTSPSSSTEMHPRNIKPNLAKQNISRMVLWTSMLSICGQVVYFFTFFDIHPIMLAYVNPLCHVLFLLSYSLDLFFYYSFNFLFRKTLQNIYRSLFTKNPVVSV